MAGRQVFLRCSYLQGLPNGTSSGPPVRGDPKGLGGKCLAHWSLECNGTIYEVGRKGAAWNPFNDLKFQWGPAKKVPFFHRELVGTTTKGHYDIRNKGDALVQNRNYNLALQNCHTVVKDLADLIIAKGSMEPNFKWPWRSVDVVGVAVGTVALVGTAWWLWPAAGMLSVTGPGGKIYTAVADWPFGGKLANAIRLVFTGEMPAFLRFGWEVGGQLVHDVPIFSLTGQWVKAKLIPLLKAAGSAGIAYLLANQPELFLTLNQGWDFAVWKTRVMWSKLVQAWDWSVARTTEGWSEFVDLLKRILSSLRASVSRSPMHT